MELLKVLSELPGAPGREEKVREFIESRIREYADEVHTDVMGNLICRKRAKGNPEDAKRVMVACHMDEIAFYVKLIDDKGFVRVHSQGGFDTRNLFARRVRIQTRDGQEIFGNLNPGGRPIHIATDEDKSKIPKVQEFFIDTGLSVEEVKERVRPGDPVTLVQEFMELGDLVTGKCLDNRAACWVGVRLLETLKETSYDLYVVFTVQEEVGLRGAITASYGIEPEISIAVDTTLAVDTPGVPGEEQITGLGKGTAIKVLDGYMISDKGLVDEFVDLAEDKEIPYQYEVLPMGGTDGGAMQRARAGSRAITLSIPTRYIHTVTETIHRGDLQATVDLLSAYLSK